MALDLEIPRSFGRRSRRLLIHVLRARNAVFEQLKRLLPKRLYARSLIIVIAPMVILQGVIVFVFMERHWQMVTQRLSEAVARDISAVIDIYEAYRHIPDIDERLAQIASERLGLNVNFVQGEDLPPTSPKPFFSLLDQALSEEITRNVGRPYWIDTVGRSNLIEIRIKLDGEVMRIIARRSQAYASNSHIFLVWMVGTSLVLLIIALLFLRNQIRPIVRLAHAADAFGKGWPVGEFRPSGATEVREAAAAFIAMRERIERQMDQRTTMLAGVSHDLRTILTRFKLQLALLGKRPGVADLTRDVDEMQRMLEAYLAFARGDQGEQASNCDIAGLVKASADAARLRGVDIKVQVSGEVMSTVKQGSFKRCIDNLVGNAAKFADRIEITLARSDSALTITIDDDGPGIPEDELEAVFKPFYRLDIARNQDEGGTGLGLAIARDIARSHGGDIMLSASPLGGLRAELTIPV